MLMKQPFIRNKPKISESTESRKEKRQKESLRPSVALAHPRVHCPVVRTGSRARRPTCWGKPRTQYGPGSHNDPAT